jgi:hypothetical protein
MDTEVLSEGLSRTEDREQADDIDFRRASSWSAGDSYLDGYSGTYMKARVDDPLFSTSQKMRKRIALKVSSDH